VHLKSQWKKLALMAAVFAACYYMPIGRARFDNAVTESLQLVKWYAREHVLLCLVPAFFIAGAIAVFVSQASVMKYLGAKANKILAYTVASVSGTVLAVCSCTVLPLFAGIYKMGAGLGPAIAFLYSGPAINVLAIILTARILGLQIGIARAVGAIIFSIVIGLLMHLIFRKEELQKANAQVTIPQQETTRPLWKNAVYFATMVAILVFANWARSGDVRAVFTGQEHEIPSSLLKGVEDVKKQTLYEWIHRARWIIVAILLFFFALMVRSWFARDELLQWLDSTWSFTVQILPLLLAGVLIAGLLLARPGREGLIPTKWINAAVGGNSIRANLFAAVAGAFMYFATLTEVPILQGLIGAGMGKGPALALLLAGPAVSLPNMLVIRSVIGTKKTIVFVALVIVMATCSGIIFGAFFKG